MVVTVAPAIALRPYTPADAGAVLELIAADRLPGQPNPTPGMLTEALEGRSPVDAGWWAELSVPVTQVAVGAAGDVLGVISYDVQPRDDAGFIVWLHCRETPAVADALVRHAAAALGPRDLGAFEFATALTRGLEALPAGHRPATDAVLRTAGFTGTALWRYLHTALPRPGLPTAGQVRIGPDPEHPDSWKLEIVRRGRLLAEALIGCPSRGSGSCGGSPSSPTPGAGDWAGRCWAPPWPPSPSKARRRPCCTWTTTPPEPHATAPPPTACTRRPDSRRSTACIPTPAPHREGGQPPVTDVPCVMSPTAGD